MEKCIYSKTFPGLKFKIPLAEIKIFRKGKPENFEEKFSKQMV